MKKNNIALCLLMIDKAVALECPEYADIRLLNNILLWDSHICKTIYNEIKCSIELGACGIDEKTAPFCWYNKTLDGLYNCNSCLCGEMFNKCSHPASLWRILRTKKETLTLTNEWYRQTIENIETVIDILKDI